MKTLLLTILFPKEVYYPVLDIDQEFVNALA